MIDEGFCMNERRLTNQNADAEHSSQGLVRVDRTIP